MDKQTINTLNKLSKNEIIDLLDELIASNRLTEQSITEHLIVKEMSNEENEIVNKLTHSCSLEENEKQYIKDTLDKKINVKIDSLLHSKDKFIKALAEFKAQHYFSLAWNIYPKKVGKQLGYKAFIKLIKDSKLKDLDHICAYILQKIKEYKQMCERENKEEQFIMHFATFCNSKKYL